VSCAFLSSNERYEFDELHLGFRQEFDRFIEFRHLAPVYNKQETVSMEARTSALKLNFPIKKPARL